MNKRIAIYILAAFALSFATSSVSIAASNINCNFKQLTKRIYVIVGSDHEACPADEVKHPLTNPSVIVGETGVIVVDPGSSLQVGRLVLERLKRITNKPVVAVFNTHIHGLYWLGNQAIKERFPDVRIYAHKRMIEHIESGEGSFWVNAITGKFLGEKTQYVVPDIPLSGGEVEVISGVTFKLHHPGRAHTDHDIMIEVPEERTLFLGGVVVEPEVPSQGVPQDAEFKGQIAATRLAISLAADKYVPGRGHFGGVELPKRGLRFLGALYGGVTRYYKDGLSDFEITERLKVDLAAHKQWYDFDKLGGVISQMYLQIESADFQ
ncbi:MAG: MBL fold metallo-hydrolase [Candidatus Thermoplasmatota archaeon]|nr:MBL fold metallo-hydrolase [Candidatus Thermoplasmatota archaeon]